MANTIYLTGVPGPAGVLDAPSFGQFPIDVGANAVNIHAARGLGYLLRAGVIDPNNPTLIQGPPYPAGFWDVPTGFEVGFAGGRSTIYPAASLGRSSKPSDTPANTYVPGKVININYGVRLFTGIEPSPQGAGGLGAIVLPDPRGDLDSYIDLAWDGATLDILRGQPLALFNTYSVVARMTAAGILYDQRHKELRLRDLGWQLAAGELHGLRYGGTGGTDGDAAVAGQMKPYGVGVVTNATPVKIGATLECYQLSCSSIQSVDAVRDGGVALTFDANYASYVALAAATVPAGRYATCLAEGFLRLGSTVVYSLTVDFHGDADTVNGRGYPSTRAAIARRVATGRGTIRLSESQIDSVAFNAFDAEYTAACGWYWRDAVSKADALNEIMAGCLGWWVMRLSGVLAIGALGEPTGTPALVLNFPEDFAGEPKMMDTYMAPRRASYVGWARNYTPQDPSQLAASVDQAQALIWAAQQRLVLASDDFQANIWPTSAVVATAGNFALESAALAEARRQQSVMGVRRERWTVPVPCDPFSDLLGRVVQINNYNRFGWGTARKFICVGMSFASGRTVNLEMWG